MVTARVMNEHQHRRHWDARSHPPRVHVTGAPTGILRKMKVEDAGGDVSQERLTFSGPYAAFVSRVSERNAPRNVLLNARHAASRSGEPRPTAVCCADAARSADEADPREPHNEEIERQSQHYAWIMTAATLCVTAGQEEDYAAVIRLSFSQSLINKHLLQRLISYHARSQRYADATLLFDPRCNPK
ncbi:hypothetical protein ROHU_023239 [Labeo rohita]|uniref:Uncharacterized protein n=1 Tax=Labeo rohita TaxID=84645 RepID=A0A498MPT4_LABRO|nr:hypothetical protein ROHU_023239 [Labeo rohita]